MLMLCSHTSFSFKPAIIKKETENSPTDHLKLFLEPQTDFVIRHCVGHLNTGYFL